uniref:Cupin-like domain-containing protein n=1 Tax=viral metagenome TaxID=1070528 RepID=A0A6C0E2E2_9ZZZZ
MIKLIIGLFIFCIILFLYLHIQFHFKTSDDLEIFEIEQASKDRLEEVCDFRQPLLIDLEEEHHKILQSTSKSSLTETYPVFEVKIRDVLDINPENDLYVPLKLLDAVKLFQEDTKSTYFSENNDDFLTETGVLKTIQQNDEYLRPPLVSSCKYDIIMGSKDVFTPFRYLLNYRNYFMVTQGSVQIKLSPPKNSKYLYPIQDYENFEFVSPINPWNVQSRYKADFDKMKCLEINLVPGRCLFIPAYWWHSFKFSYDSSITCFYYKTYMNEIATLPQSIMYFLQNQNVQRKVTNQVPTSETSIDTSIKKMTQKNYKVQT